MVAVQHEAYGKIEKRIIEVLEDHPYITRSMLSAHVASYGSNLGLEWGKVLDNMIKEGSVIRETRINERTNRSSIVLRVNN